MNFVLQIENEIYGLMEDITATPDQGAAYENMYWAARGMCRVLCQFTNDSDECDMFDRIQQAVLQQIANDTANKEDDDREEGQQPRWMSCSVEPKALSIVSQTFP